MYYSGRNSLFQSTGALTPIEIASLGQCLEDVAQIVPDGSWDQDFTAYTRISHGTDSFLFPLQYLTTSCHKRLVVLIFELGMTYFILACFTKTDIVAPTIISPQPSGG